MMDIVIEEQNRRLIEYAKKTIIEIGDKIKTYHSANNMDRTGHLLDSLCWGVSYGGKLVDGGYYRQSGAKGASYLHEWFSGDAKYATPVNGRQLAQQYIESYGNNGSRGWRVFFAILAPYWGYWEKGFKMKSHFGGGEKFVQFAVMTQFYDKARADLKPMRVRFRVSVAKYNRQAIEKKWKKISGL